MGVFFNFSAERNFHCLNESEVLAAFVQINEWAIKKVCIVTMKYYVD